MKTISTRLSLLTAKKAAIQRGHDLRDPGHVLCYEVRDMIGGNSYAKCKD